MINADDSNFELLGNNYILYTTIYNTYSTSQSTIWENILRARKIFSRAKGE